jgi:hypothetical protein
MQERTMRVIRKSWTARLMPVLHVMALMTGATLILLCAGAQAAVDPSQPSQNQTLQHLPGHLLPALAQATTVSSMANVTAPLTLTFVLKRDDEAGFQHYLHDVYDPASATFRHFLTQAQISERYGPSQQTYDQIATYLDIQNFVLVQGSTNRLTLTASSARANVERSLALHIRDYSLRGRVFFANDDAPVLPAWIASHTSAVLGLSNLAHSQRIGNLSQGQPKPPADGSLALTCQLSQQLDGAEDRINLVAHLTGVEFKGSAALSFATTILHYQCAADELNLIAEYAANAGGAAALLQTSALATSSSSGAGQKIGLAEFATYNSSDVLGFLNLIEHPERLAQLSDVYIGAGANFTIEGESEVLLDIDTLLSLAPGANVAVYNAGFHSQGSFQTMFNSMIGGGVNIISNSWAYCENQTSLADVQSLDSILQTAAASGITVLTGAGDSGSTCLDGSPNTVAVPAGSPNITAVGGTSALPGLAGSYGSETWWDGTAHTPATGQGGFGLSQFFTRPAYQNGISAQAMRSVPDVTAPADPAHGVLICQADNGGCPSNLLYGGTSIAAPIWAAFVAVLNQRMNLQLGFLNPQLYALANSSGFHTAAAMGSDFAHVGLGSPNVAELRRLLSGGSAGSVSTTNAALVAFPPNVYADGSSIAGVTVLLLDANFNTLGGKSVTLTANTGSSAIITPINSISDSSNGAARFTITDTVSETVTFTAATSTGTLLQTAQVKFVGPPATAAGISATPTTQIADGASKSTITVTLQDALGRPAPGKKVLLSQGQNSLILGANPGTTAGNGTLLFDVIDQVSEIAVYTAIDVTDDNLPIPASTSVNFSNALAGSCGSSTPLAAPGYAISVYASGFPVQNGVPYGGITLNGCTGVTGIAFDSAGNLFASDYVTGDVYKFPPGGGIADASHHLPGTAIGPSLGGLAFGADGTLYATRVATSNTATSGAVLKIDQTRGIAAIIGPNIPCPSYLVTDPLSGDLFISDFCYGGTQQSADITRIANPASASPTKSLYATSSFAPNGSLSFAADGTLYAVYGYTNFGGLFGGIDQISASNISPLQVQAVAGAQSTFSALAVGTNPAGGAQALIVGTANTGGYAHSVAVLDTTVTPSVFSGTTLIAADVGSAKIFGPDHCLYLANVGAVYKLNNADGSCPLNGLAPNPSMVINPQTEPATLTQGSSLRFDVTFPHNLNLPVGTPITYMVSGANPLLGTAAIGFGGLSFAYTGKQTGSDTVMALAQINGTTVTSNSVPVTWTAGKHSTFLDLNKSVSSGTIGSSTALSATLIDTSAKPFAPIAQATLQFTLAGQSCSASTDVLGQASCNVTISALTQCTLYASYAGDSQYLPIATLELFAVSIYDVIFSNGFEPRLFGGGCD